MTHMSNATKITFIVIFVLLAFGAMCASQTFDRTSLSHYLCWIAAFGALGGFAFVVSKIKNEGAE